MKRKLPGLFLLLFLLAGLSAHSQLLLSENFSTATGTTPPTGWSNVDLNSSGEIWYFNNPGNRTLPTSMTSPAAIFDSDYNGNNGLAEDAALESPAFNASSGNIILTFDHAFTGGFGGAYAVEVYNGSTWTSVLSGTTSTSAAAYINITSATGASTNAKVRFRWTGSYSYYWIVDNVAINAVNCVNPTALSASSITATSATLNWNSTNATAWTVEYGNSGFTPGTGTTVAVSAVPFNLTSLTPNTNYSFYVRSTCGSNQSGWSGPATFKTLCAPVSTYPYMENFATTVPPTCWDEADAGTPASGPSVFGSGSWTTDGFGNVGTTGAAKINLYSNTRSDWLISPSFNLTGGPYQAELDFGVFQFGSTNPGTLGSDDQVQFLVSLDGGTTWANIRTVNNTYVTPPGGEHVIVDLTSLAGATVKFAVWASEGTVDDTQDNDVMIDNFEIKLKPSCAVPSALSSSNLTATSATLNWTSGGATSWDIEYGAPGFTLGTGTRITVSTKPYTLTSLMPQTNYQVYVRDNCGGGVTSNWSTATNFTTPCTAQLSGTYTINSAMATGGTNFASFNAAVAQLSSCGVSGPVIFNVAQGTYTERVIIGNISGNSTTNTITFKGDPSNTADALITEAASATTNNYVIRFDGASNVILDDLSVSGTGTSFSRAIEFTGANQNIKIQNSVLSARQAGSTSLNHVVIFETGGTTHKSSNISILDNQINYGSYGIYLLGSSTTDFDGAHLVSGNTISEFYNYGIRAYYVNNIIIKDNIIKSGTATTSVNSTVYGIYNGYSDFSTVSGNLIVSSGTTANYGIHNYYNDASAASPNLIANNMITLEGHSGAGYGIYPLNNYYTDIVYNSVNVVSGSATSSRAMYFNSATTGTYGFVRMLNNNAVNTGVGYTAEISADAVTLGYVTASNYNNIYGTGATLVRVGSTNYATLAAYQTATSLDMNSVSVDPLFAGPTDLHVSEPTLNNAATPFPGITVDFDGDARSATTPDIGADEFSPPSCLPSVNAMASNITGSSADLSWTAGGGTTFNIEYGTSGFVQGSGNLISGVGNPYTLSLLQELTTYDFYVQDNCGASGTSPWSGPFSFTTGCNASMAGVYTINGANPSGGTNFATFAEAASRLSNCGISAPVTFNIAPGMYTESLVLTAINGSSATNTVTFDGSDSALVHLTFASTTDEPTIYFDGADYVTIRNMTVSNTSTDDGWGILFRNASNNNTIENSHIKMPVTTTTDIIGIVASASLTSETSTGDNANNLSILNNLITGGESGVHLTGGSASASHNTGNKITGNKFRNQDDHAIEVDGQTNLEVKSNHVRNLVNSAADAIYLVDVDNFTVSENDVISPDYGIYINDGNDGFSPSANSRVVNNMVISSTDYGLYLDDFEYTEVYHNTFYGEPAMLINDQSNTLIIKNNIMVSNGDYAFESTDALNASDVIDYNLYYSTATNSFEILSAVYSDLAAWKTATPALNVNSLEGDPIFLSSTDLHVLGSLPNGTADATVGVTADIDGDLRSANPDMGADEYSPASCLPSSAVMVSMETSNSAQISWTAGGGSSWNLEVGAKGFAPGSGTLISGITANPYTLTALMPNTEYEFYLQDDCGAQGTSVWVGPYSIQTLCLPTTAPFSEDFGSLTVGHFNGSNNCWIFESNNPGSDGPSGFSWEVRNSVQTTSTNTGPAGDNTLYPATGGVYLHADNSGAALGDSTRLFSPMIDLTGQTSPVLSFYYHYFSSPTSAYNQKLYVDLYNGSNWIRDIYSLTAPTHTASTDPWTQVTLDLSAYNPTGTMQVRFRQFTGTSVGGAGDISLDDVSITTSPAMPCDTSTASACVYTFNQKDSYGDGWNGAILLVYQGGVVMDSLTFAPVLGGQLDVLKVTDVVVCDGVPAYVVVANAGSWPSEIGLEIEAFGISQANYASGTTPTMAAGDTILMLTPNCTPPACAIPTALGAYNITAVAADIYWTTGGATNWNVEYGISGFSPGSGMMVNATNDTLSLSGLSPATAYQFYVRDSCGVGNTSNWAGPYSFSTNCPPSFMAPWTEAFGPAIPLCWSQGTANAEPWRFANSPGFNHIGNNGAISGSTNSGGYFAWVDDSSPHSTGTTLQSPMIDVSALTSPLLKFYMLSHNEGFTNVNFSVQVWDGAAWNVVYTRSSNTVGGWEEISVPLSGLTLTGNMIQLRFIVDENNGTDFYDDVAIDDVSIIEAPSCPAPTMLGATNITDVSADIYWTGGGAANWNIAYGPAGFTPATAIMLNSTNDTVNLTGLSAATNYQFYVRDSCAIGDVSVWKGPFDFATRPCAASSSCSYVFNLIDSYGDGWNGGEMKVYQNGVSVGTLTFPAVLGGTNDVLKVMNLDLCDNQMAYVVVTNAGSFASEIGLDVNTPFGATAGTYAAGTTPTLAAGDTIMVISASCAAPPCAAPTNLSASSQTATSANVSWTSGGASDWNIQYGPAGFVPGSGIIVSSTATTYTISGLSANLAYEFYVRDSCGVGIVSSWTGPFQFGGLVVPCDNFDAYAVGAADAQSILLNGWAGAPGDASISTDYASSGTQSLKIYTTGPAGYSDVVAQMPNYTSGQWNMAVDLYIPASYGGYYNILHNYAGSGTNVWAMEVNIDASGTATVVEGTNGSGTIGTYTVNMGAWNTVEHMIDLDNDTAFIVVNGTPTNVGWQFSLGSANFGNQFNAMNFFSSAPTGLTPLIYFDNFCVSPVIIRPPSCAPFVSSIANDTLCAPGLTGFMSVPPGNDLVYIDPISGMVRITSSSLGIQNNNDTTISLNEVVATSNTGNVGPLTNIAASGFGNFSNGQFITVMDTIRIDSMTVRASGVVTAHLQIWTTDPALGGSLLQIGESFTTGSTLGDYQVPVGTVLTPGVYFMNVNFTGGSGGLFRATSGATYPYVLPGLMSIDSTNFSNQARIYYTFDMVVTEVCLGAAQSVTSYIKGLSAGSDVSIILCDNGASIDLNQYLTADANLGGTFFSTNASAALSGSMLNPSLLAIGTYQVGYATASTAQCPADTSVINIQIQACVSCAGLMAPVTVNDTLCGPGAATLGASSTATDIVWYNPSNEIVNYGSSFTANVTASTNFMAYSVLSAGPTITAGPPISISQNIYPTANFTNGQWITVSQNVRIDSAVFAVNGPLNFVVAISNAQRTDTLQTSKVISFSGADTSAKEIGIYLTPGVYFINTIPISGTGVLWRPTGGANYPYGVSNILTVDSSDFGPTRLYYLYEMQVSAACISSGATAVAYIAAGSNPGQSDSVQVCETSTSVNLNSLLGTFDPGGTWYDDDASGALSGSTVNPNLAGLGVYNYTYVIAGVGNCPSDSATITLTVTARPFAGNDSSISLCNSNTSFVLLMPYITGANMGGTWTDLDASGMLTAGNRVRPSLGTPGTYRFRYTLPSTAVCAGDTSVVTITIAAVVNAGNSASDTICDTAMAVNLSTYLGANVTAGGTWLDLDGSGGLSGNMFNPAGVTVGATYRLAYFVSSAVCGNDTAIVSMYVSNCGISLPQYAADFVKLYPNPTSGKLYLQSKLSGSADARIEILDMNSRLLWREQYQLNDVLNLDISHFAKGVYNLRISTESGVQVFRIVKD